MDFALERIRSLEPDIESEEYLLEIAWMYDRVVQSGSLVPVVDLSYELVLPLDFVAEVRCFLGRFAASSKAYRRTLSIPMRVMTVP